MATGRPVENPQARYEETGEPFLSTHNPNGAHTWHSMSFSPLTKLVYLPIHGTPFIYGAAQQYTTTEMATNLGTDFSGNAALDPQEVLAQTYGRLIAWDPVKQQEVWRVERAGQANGGALSTAGGLVFQGTGSGQVTALDASTGAELWSFHAQTGIIAAPISYAIDGEQYIAIMAGTGGSWAMIGGDTNMKGYALENESRLLVFKLGGTAQLPAPTSFTRPPMNPPPHTASDETIAMGAPLFETYCGSCHGAGVIGVGLLPDLRRTPYLNDPEAFAQVVLGGALAPNGMASFASVLNQEQAQAVRAYIIMRANQDAAANQQ
jgi:alcohol dehydrogenase (cytochrome c)/quinohemoprotein ethanol dehydrogenase